MSIFKDLENPRLWESLLVLALGIITWAALTRMYYKNVPVEKGHRNSFDKQNGKTKTTVTTGHIAFSLARLFVTAIFVLWILHINHINITATVAGLGIVSVILGIALQDSMKDYFHGVSLLSDRFFKVGDYIQFNGMVCEVIGFTLRSTKLRDVDSGSIITVFNGQLNSVVRASGVQFLDIKLSYEEDYKYVDKVMTDITTKISAIDGIKLASYKAIQDFEDSGIVYRIKITTRQYDRFDLRRAALRAIQEGLDEAGIKIPFNQLDVHMDSKN